MEKSPKPFLGNQHARAPLLRGMYNNVCSMEDKRDESNLFAVAGLRSGWEMWRGMEMWWDESND